MMNIYATVLKFQGILLLHCLFDCFEVKPYEKHFLSFYTI